MWASMRLGSHRPDEHTYFGLFVLPAHFGQTGVSTGICAPHTLHVMRLTMIFSFIWEANGAGNLWFRAAVFLAIFALIMVIYSKFII